MFTAQEYLYGWLIYLAGAVGGMVVWWFLTRRIPAGVLRDVVRLSGAVLLLMPYSIGPDYGYLVAPAIMMTLVDGILVEDAGFARAGIPLLVGWAVSIALYFALRYGWRHYRAARQHRGEPPVTEHGETRAARRQADSPAEAETQA